MNKNLQMVYTYHNDTKHSQQRYAKSLGYMDWDTQPNPFRTYSNTKKTKLPLSFENNTLEYSQIFTSSKDNNPSAPLCIEAISQFFQFSLGLAAIKEYQGQSWALRCNASSGNLHPTEAYIIASSIQNIENGLYHYSPKEHELELLSSSQKELSIPKNSFLISLSSIVWREAWKYGERAWRYTQLDCGHALKALEISASILGWKIEVINTKDSELQDLIGVNQSNRYVPEERELTDMLILVSANGSLDNNDIDIKNLRSVFQKNYEGKANQLSLAWHKWGILEEIENATLSDEVKIKNFKNDTYETNDFRLPSYSSKDIVMKRRSAQIMDKDDCTISKKEFETIIASVKSNISPVNLVLYVHSVEGYESGLYILIRNPKNKNKLQELTKSEFLWEKIDTNAGELYKLKDGDYKFLAKAISCNQDIASQGAFSLGMLVEFQEELEKFGASRYKELYWECGAIGQQLYLETTSLSLSATGIGCFLDDVMHTALGLSTHHFQSLYHFTVGRGLVDTRLTTKKPY